MTFACLSLVLSILLLHPPARCETGLENGKDLMSFVTVGAWRFCRLNVVSLSWADGSHLASRPQTAETRGQEA
jgi:hypothetical protein